MLNGDISNYTEYTMAFRVDDFLVKLNKRNGFFRFSTSYTLNEEVVRALKTVYYKTPYTVDLVLMLADVYDKNSFDKIREFIDDHDIPYGNIHVINNDMEIRTHLTINTYSYYIHDEANERFSRIGKSDCVLSLADLYKIISWRL